MLLNSLIDNLLTDTYTSLALFVPELVLCVTILVLLLARLFRWGERIDPFVLAVVGAGIGFWYTLPSGDPSQLAAAGPQEIFTGMLIYDSLTVFLRMLLLFFAVLFVVLTRLSGLADRQDGQDFYVLVLGATLGMCIMASANHLMTVFLGVEMASVPSYVLAGVVKGRRRASEASLKYVVYGAGAAGVMLYGISLLAGVLGTAHLPSLAVALADLDIAAMIASGEGTGKLMVLALSSLMIMAGLAFKLSAVPFHFWCPDVFEGATAEVGAFLSVASKAAALALLVRVALGVSAIPADDATMPSVATNAAVVRTVALESDAGESDTGRLLPVQSYVVKLLAIMAAVTCTFGNLAAYGQSNIKRLLAYSTIAHAGYMIMPVAAAVQLAGNDIGSAREAVSALLLYAAVYLFMNLGAFSIVAFLRNEMQSESIADYGGLIRQCPLTVVAFTCILFSLVGLPPLAGFVGKFAIFMSLVDAGGWWMIFLLVVAGLNTAVSLVYYLRVAKTMCMDPEPETRGPVSMPFLPAVYTLAIALPVVLLGILWQPLREITLEAGSQLFM